MRRIVPQTGGRCCGRTSAKFPERRISNPLHYRSANLPKLAGSQGIEPSASRLATVFKTVCAPCTQLPVSCSNQLRLARPTFPGSTAYLRDWPGAASLLTATATNTGGDLRPIARVVTGYASQSATKTSNKPVSFADSTDNPAACQARRNAKLKIPSRPSSVSAELTSTQKNPCRWNHRINPSRVQYHRCSPGL